MKQGDKVICVKDFQCGEGRNRAFIQQGRQGVVTSDPGPWPNMPDGEYMIVQFGQNNHVIVPVDKFAVIV